MNENQEKLLKALEDYYDEKDKNRVHTPGKDVIQHAGPYLRKEEFMAAIGTLLKEWMVQGENAQKFENEFCKLMGQPYGVVTNSGSSANLLMLAALKSKNTFNLKKAKIEWHRKFSLSFACIIMFLIGAPLGSIIRKGGLGMPVLISILFFLVYHIYSITGEKSALQDVISVSQGMWISSLILTPLGLFLTIQACNDLSFFEVNFHRKFLLRIKQVWTLKKY